MEQPMSVRDGMQVVEEGKRLSECLLWKLQEDFYANAGLSAWDAIPYYPTSNPHIGEIFAEIILNFLDDVSDHLDWNEPFYILELATGSGAFSFYLLKELQRKLAYFKKLQPLKLCYVMTDFTDSIVVDWVKSDKLKPFLDAGLLDLAVFRPEDQAEIRLIQSGKTLAPGAVKNPVVAIANYFFDSIRQDQFRVENHQLYETRLTFTRSLEDIDPGSPVTLGQLNKTESYVPTTTDYYADETMNRVLKQYTEMFENASILFPIGGFRCLSNLLKLSGDKLLLISADKGFTGPDYMLGHREQLYTPHHGAFSYMVNFDAMARYLTLRNGFAMADDGNTSILNMLCAGVMSGFEGTPERTRYYFEENVVKKDGVNNVNLTRRLANPERYDDLALLRAGIGMIQLGNHDPLLLYEASDHILKGIGESLWMSDYKNILATLEKVKENVFVADYRTNIYHEMEKIYFRLRRYPECREVAQESLNRFGPTAQSLTHMAACYELEGQADTAKSYYQQALAVDPESETIKTALSRL